MNVSIINLPNEIILNILTKLTPNTLMNIINTHDHFKELVRCNIILFIKTFRNNNEINNILWDNFDNTFDSFIKILKMHSFAYSNTNAFFLYYLNKINSTSDKNFELPQDENVLYKYKLYFLLLNKIIGIPICVYILDMYINNNTIQFLEDDIEFDNNLKLNMFYKLMMKYPQFGEYIKNNNSAIDIMYLDTVIEHFLVCEEDGELEERFDFVDNLILHGIRPSEAFEFLFEELDTEQMFMNINNGISSQFSYKLISNNIIPTASQIEQYNLYKSFTDEQFAYDIIFGSSE
jgi:hypothetical protein